MRGRKSRNSHMSGLLEIKYLPIIDRGPNWNNPESRRLTKMDETGTKSQGMIEHERN